MAGETDSSVRRERLAIIGPGKVGTALGVLAGRAGWPVAAVGGRNLAAAREAAAAIGPEVRAGSAAEAAAAGQLVLLTVSDDAIETVCDQLAAAGALGRGSIVAHCCGALSSEVLSSAREKCICLVASMHPLQTFPTVEAAIERLPGAYFFCEGDGAALGPIEEFIGRIGGKAVRIGPGSQRKALYHAGAVMACNHLAALMDAAVEMMQQAGVRRDVSLAALHPLVRATIENITDMGPEVALTGPVARGDVDTIRRHIRALAGEKGPRDLEAFYRAAARWTVELAKRKGAISESVAEALLELLEGKA